MASGHRGGLARRDEEPHAYVQCRDERGDEPEGGLAIFVAEGEDGEDRAWDAEEEGGEVEGFLRRAAAVVDGGSFVEEEEGEGDEGGSGVERENEEWGRHEKWECSSWRHSTMADGHGVRFWSIPEMQIVRGRTSKLCFFQILREDRRARYQACLVAREFG